TKEKIVLQNFRIEGLSIKSCFQRMNYITASMFEDIIKGEHSSIKEKEKNLTKFYYMAIRLIREYLQEGKYVQKDDMTLVKAMDYRLACEKLERLADELKNISGKKTNEKVLKLAEKINQEYMKITSAFLNEDFEEAIKMWNKYKQYTKESIALEKKLKNEQSKEVLHSYMKVLEYIKDISNLVRGKK
ncbi:MAG: hypothetical protein KKA79_02470, partial [Nanoarchaeota archaeon]|nr:hypothetical protein [Nanoarchaeota archaeon]